MAANYLFNKVNAILEIHSKINESPFDALALVFFLFKHEHVMIEELLQLLVGEVNAELLETVVLQEVMVGQSQLVLFPSTGCLWHISLLIRSILQKRCFVLQ